jgi:hypothetical protein
MAYNSFLLFAVSDIFHKLLPVCYGEIFHNLPLINTNLLLFLMHDTVWLQRFLCVLDQYDWVGVGGAGISKLFENSEQNSGILVHFATLEEKNRLTYTMCHSINETKKKKTCISDM